ncbi:substrate-binding domain-containing protein [Sporosarcina sp. A2]|uniref:substrate-binding domain-containing protein n=1 Tax=Sporosarcina sp. A2 TaxID=3393449 RepID=UPI003D7B987E
MNYWTIGLMISYWTAIALNFITARLYPAIDLTWTEFIPSLLFLIVLIIVVGRFNISKKLFMWVSLFIVVTYLLFFAFYYYGNVIFDIPIINVLAGLKIPIYHLFITPLLGLNFLLHITPILFPLVTACVYTLALVLLRFKKSTSEIKQINDMSLVKGVLATIIFVLLAIPTVFGYMILYLDSLVQFIPILIAVVVFLYSAFVLYQYHLLNTKRRKQTFLIVLIAVSIAVSIWPIQAAYSERKERVNSVVDMHKFSPCKDSSWFHSKNTSERFQWDEATPELNGEVTVFPLYSAFVGAVYPESCYELERSQLNVSQDEKAVERLVRGYADIIFTPTLSRAQQQYVNESGKTLKITPIAKDALVFYVNKNNPITSLRIEQIQKIYSGEFTNWSQLFYYSEPILPLQYAPKQVTQGAIELIMGEIPLVESLSEYQSNRMIDMIRRASEFPDSRGSIGFTYNYYASNLVHDPNIKLLEIDGIAPTEENILSKEYPLMVDLYAVTASETNRNVEPFIDWILSEEGQKLVQKTGYAPLEER